LTPQRLELLTQALQAFQSATNTFILLIPFQPTKDLAIAEKLQRALKDSSQIITLTDPRELKGLFRYVTMTIGMRLHSLIMAAAENCSCFALSYDPKVSQLMKECQLPGWKLSDLPTDADLISQAWIENYNRANSSEVANIKIIAQNALIHQELLNNYLGN
jgi:polysaccharide pyruvyl transferase WcaK-like protein